MVSSYNPFKSSSVLVVLQIAFLGKTTNVFASFYLGIKNLHQICTAIFKKKRVLKPHGKTTFLGALQIYTKNMSTEHSLVFAWPIDKCLLFL